MPPVVPSLSIVIPVYNEPEWIAHSVAEAAAAVRKSPFAKDAEFVIVDDGSDSATKEALAGLEPGVRTRVLSQENRGRFLARRAGIQAARGQLVLLLDSRVLLEDESMSFIAERLDGDRLPVWNGHIEVDVTGNPFARFWRTITYAAWRDYLANPRTTSFGLEEYDRFPKGTTCFLAPRESLLRAMDRFRSLYDDTRFANDDTVLIRSIAAEQRINISPGFAATYISRDSLPSFLRHTLHRGTVFVDGFARPGTRFSGALMAFFPASLGFVVLALMKPRWALRIVAAGPLTAALGAIALRRPPRDVAAFALLSGPFAAAYAAGIWRGALLGARARIGR
jgi:Glycosyl transferase family 2